MAYRGFEDLEVYRLAERIADRCYEVVSGWNAFDKETVGEQLVRAADSIGANIAEGHGRHYYGDQLRFLYYARGNLAETRHWMRRVRRRKMLPSDAAEKALAVLEELAKKLNAYISSIRRKRAGNSKQSADSLAEALPYYNVVAYPKDMDGIETDFLLSGFDDEFDAEIASDTEYTPLHQTDPLF